MNFIQYLQRNYISKAGTQIRIEYILCEVKSQGFGSDKIYLEVLYMDLPKNAIKSKVQNRNLVLILISAKLLVICNNNFLDKLSKLCNRNCSTFLLL